MKTFKRISSAILSLIMIAAMLPVGAFPVYAATRGITGDCTWELNGTELTICGNGAMADYSSDAPWGTDITKVTIDTDVTTVGQNAFSDCIWLTSVTIPESVTKIGRFAFANCSALTSITIPEGVTELGDYAFSGVTGLKSIVIPESVTSIGSMAFHGCTGLAGITVPDGVTEIGDYAFEYCSALENITVSDGNTKYHSAGNCLIETESKTLISGCKNSVIPTDGSVTELGSYAFHGCTGLASFTIPFGVTKLGVGAFSDCTGLTSIVIPDSVTSIGGFAFSGCIALTSAIIGKGVTRIETGTFYECTDLATVTIPDGVTNIDDGAFSGCTGLENVYYHGTAEQKATITVGQANSPLTDLTWVYLYTPEAPVLIGFDSSSITVTAVDGVLFSVDGKTWQESGSFTGLDPGKKYTVYAKYDGDLPAGYDDFGMSSITVQTDKKQQNAVPLPPIIENKTSTTITLTAIPGCEYSIDGENWQSSPMFTGLSAGTEYTFYQRYAETEAYYAGKKSDPLTVKLVSGGTTGDCTWEVDGTKLHISGSGEMADYTSSSCAPWGTGITQVTFDDGVTYIGESSFEDCFALTSVTIGSGITCIGEYAFSGCSALTALNIPDSVTYICSGAFSGCTGIESIVIGNGVTDIDSTIFYGCSGITSITVRDGNKQYHSAGNCLIETASKTIIRGCNTSVIPTDGSITKLGDFAFWNCIGLKSVTIPDSVTVLGSHTFAGCTGIERVTIGNGVTCIDGYSFGDCEKLATVNIPDSVTDIYEDAFSGCKALKSITIPDSVTTIATAAFSGCAGLESVTIGSGVIEISISVFEGCVSLTNITVREGNKKYHSDGNCLIDTGNQSLVAGCKNSIIPNDGSVTGIGRSAFAGCAELTKISIPDSVTSIATAAFSNCEGLESVTLGNGIGAVGSRAFAGCTALKNVYYYGTAEEKSGIEIGSSNSPLTDLTWVYLYRPAAPVLTGLTTSSLTVMPADDLLFSIDGANWQPSNVFTGLSIGTKYTIYSKYNGVLPAGYDDSGINYITATTDKNKQDNTPAAPTLESKTATSITLASVDGCEYSVDGENWQSSPVFTKLDLNTDYTFYQRYAETATNNAGKSSAGATFRTDAEKADQDEIPPAPTLALKMALFISLVPVDGCEYSVDGVNWQSSSSFFGLDVFTEYTFYQRYAETDTHKAGGSSEGATFKTDKYSQPKPSAPTLASKGYTTVVLVAKGGCEYSIDGENWQASPTFTGLSMNTQYTFYQRYTELDTCNPSPASDALTVMTDNKESQSKPDAPTLASKTDTTVTLVAVTGCEYSVDGINWQSSPVFTGLDPETNYFFFQRYAETDTHYASPMSASLQVKTDETPDHVPGDITGDGNVNSADLTRLLRYLNDWNVEVNEAALDVTGDGKVNSADLTRLLRYLNDWPVEIF